jgi:hypothetical protein
MMAMLMSSVLVLAAVQSAAANSARDSFRTCVKEAMGQAKTNKLAVDAFKTFVRGHCAAQEAGFTAAIWAFDSKNKVSKKQSAADAELQIEDIVVTASEKYEFEIKQ